MIAFIDFEASSLGKRSYPIEVAWVFEDGSSEAHLIRPAPDWTDWDEGAAAIHKIGRDEIVRDGMPHDLVARRMVDALQGHDLVASAPSWDGKWLSLLLRTAGLPRRTLRLRDSDDAQREIARAILAPVIPAAGLNEAVEDMVALVQLRQASGVPVHRALADAETERALWAAVRSAAEMMVAER